MQPPWHWPLVSMRNGQCFHAQCSGIALFRSNVCPSLHHSQWSCGHWTSAVTQCAHGERFLQWGHPVCTDAVSQRDKWSTQEWRHAWMDKDLRAIQKIKLLPVLTFSCFYIDRHRSTSTNRQGGALFTLGIHNLCCSNIHWFSVIYMNKWRMPKKLHTHLWAKIVVMEVLFTARFYRDRYGSTATLWKP